MNQHGLIDQHCQANRDKQRQNEICETSQRKTNKQSETKRDKTGQGQKGTKLDRDKKGQNGTGTKRDKKGQNWTGTKTDKKGPKWTGPNNAGVYVDLYRWTFRNNM